MLPGTATLAVARLSDRLANRATLLVPSLGLFAAGFLVLAFVPTLAGAVVGGVLVGVGNGGTSPTLLAYLGDISLETDIGKLGGVYNTFGDLGGTVGPVVALSVAARAGFTVEYAACVAVVGLAGVLVWVALLRPSDQGR